MSARPSDIPESVLKVAVRLYACLGRGSTADTDAIAEAILAAEKRGEERERERCAQVVDRDADLLLNCGKRATRAAERIAHAIRNPSHTNEGV